MPIAFSVTNHPADRAPGDLLAVPVFADRVLGPGADAVDAGLGGSLRKFMEDAGFAGKPDETLVVPTAGTTTAPAAILVGLGDPNEVTPDGLRRAAAAVARRSARSRSVVTTLLQAAPDGVTPAQAAQAIAEGFSL